jgi:hypothetical protein
MSHGLIQDAENYYIKGDKVDSSGYRIQMKEMGKSEQCKDRQR